MRLSTLKHQLPVGEFPAKSNSTKVTQEKIAWFIIQAAFFDLLCALDSLQLTGM